MRHGVVAIFVLLTAATAMTAAAAVGDAVAEPTLSTFAVAGYSLLKAAVVAAFSVFVLIREPSRRPSRDPIAFAACATAVVTAVAVRPPDTSQSAALVLAGDFLTLVSCAWLLVAALALGRCFGVLPEARGLVTEGPYAFVRHPLYLGELGAYAGLVVAAPRPLNIGLGVLFVSAQALRMRLEERALTDAFPEYSEYAARTPRIVPRLAMGLVPRRQTAVSALVVTGLALAALALAGAAQAGLAAPKLLSPASGARIEDKPALPTFSWDTAAGAAHYEFQVAADRGFNAPVLGAGQDRFLTRNTRATLKKTVPNGTYWWRVRSATKKGDTSPWSEPRSVRKEWTASASLQAPGDGTVVTYPTPLRLSWSAVPGAAKYAVTLATDPLLGSMVGGKPVETAAHTFTRLGALPPGVYYWGITPMDSQGNFGRPSRVYSVVWMWPSATAVRVNDLNAALEAFDPQFSWNPVPGAARYEVEVNPSQDYAPGSKVCCAGTTIGTSLSPTVVLRDNRYYWRVRAIDVSGNAGQWNEGPLFEKRFDKIPPVTGTSIKNVHMRDNVNDPGIDQSFDAGYQTNVPAIVWDPVPGASSYQVEVVPTGVNGCNWTSNVDHWLVNSSVNAWTPLGAGWNFVKPYPDQATVASDLFLSLDAGQSYCARIRARTDRDLTHADVYGEYTYVVGGAGSPVPGTAFTWLGFPDGAECTPSCNRGYLGAGDYLAPATGTVSPRTPYFTWRPLPRRAWIVLKNGGGSDALRLTAKAEGATGNGLKVSVADSSAGTDRLTIHNGLASTAYFYPEGDVAALAGQINASSTLVSANAQGSGPLASVTQAPFTPGTVSYFVLVAKDDQFSNIVDYAFTQFPVYSPRQLLKPTTYPDETTSYYWVVLPAALANGGDAVGTPVLGAARAFEKRSTPPGLVSPGPGADELDQPVFRWTPVEGARRYRLQVAQDASFGTLLDDILTNSASYTSNTTYPADATLYWRVRADDENLIGLTWSGPQTFEKRLAMPTPGGPIEGDVIPTWTWDSVPGAVSYDVSADLPDGKHQDLNGLPTAAVTPTLMWGTGLFHWKVRANFPKGIFGVIPGPFSARRPYTRKISEPTGVRSDVSKTHMNFAWEPKPGIKNYRVQVSKRSDFALNIEDVTTDNTSYAPTLTHPSYLTEKHFYWRVAAVDEGRNVGDWSPTQEIGTAKRAASAKRMTLRVRGAVKRRRASTLRVTVTTAARRPIAGATVRISGAGVRRAAARTNKRGQATFRVRAKKRGKIMVTVAKTGYALGRVRVKVR